MSQTGYRKFVIMIFTLLGTLPAFSQRSPETDSLFAKAKMNIYEKPEYVIKLGDSLYSSNESSLEDKVEALLLISDAYSSKRDYEKSLQYFKIANDLLKKSNNTDLQIIVLSRNAVRYQQMKVYDKAIECLDECDKLLLLKHDDKKFNLTRGNNYAVRGMIYKEQLNCDIAIGYFDKAIEKFKSFSELSTYPNMSITYYNKGNCYIALEDYGKAIENFDEAVKYADHVNAKSLKAFALKGLAEVYNNQGNNQKAIEVLLEASEISKNVGDLILNRGIYINLANNYKQVGNWAEYQKYNQLFLKNQALIRSSERESTGDAIEEFTTLNNEKLSTMQIRYNIMIGLEILLFFFFSYLLFSYLKRNRKSSETLKLEVKRIKDTLRKQSLS